MERQCAWFVENRSESRQSFLSASRNYDNIPGCQASALYSNGFFIREQENPRYLTLIIRLESKSIILSKKIKFKNINQNLNLDAKMKL